MTSSKLNFYLKENLDSPSIDFTWTEENNKKFFAFISENTDADYLKETKNLLKIKEAFQKYFEPVGYILFQIKDYKIRLKVFAYTLEPKDSLNVGAIVNIIDGHEHLIVDDYNGRDDQIFIKDELRQKIFDFVDTIKDEKVNKKELVKYAVRESFELKNSDIVMVKTDSIFIKMCDIVQKYNVVDAEKNIVERRFNGIDEEELHSFNKEHFSSKEDKKFFHLVGKLFVDRYLLEKNINNLEYEKNVFGYLQSIITEQLINTFDNCEEFFKGLSGYIFRIHFEEVFKNIAELILDELVISNKYIIDFLKYYSLDVIVIGGVKYKVPILEAENGLKWNVVSMLSIVKLYIKTKSTSKLLNKAIDKKEEEIISLYQDGLSPAEYNNKLIELTNTNGKKVVTCEYKLDVCYDSLKLSKDDDEKNKLKKEISSIKKDLQNLKVEKGELSNKSISRSDINKAIAIEKEIDQMRKLLKREERVLAQNDTSFQSIKMALVKALISKKQRI